MTDFPSGENMSMPVSNMDRQDGLPISAEYLSGYEENADHFWIPQDSIPKTFEQPTFP
jgi:hypothetical protein